MNTLKVLYIPEITINYHLPWWNTENRAKVTNLFIKNRYMTSPRSTWCCTSRTVLSSPHYFLCPVTSSQLPRVFRSAPAVMGTVMLSGEKKKSGHAGRATELGFVPPLPSCSCSILSASLAAGAQLETRAPSPNPLHPGMPRAFAHFPAAGGKV